MLVRKAYKFRLYANQEQQAMLAVQFGHARFVYNYFLQKRQEYYEETGKGLHYRQTADLLTRLKQDPSHEWLKDADSQVLQQKLKDLDRAYKNFFEKRGKYPRFRNRRAKQSIRYPQRVKVDLDARRSYLPKVGWVKTIFHRSLEGQHKNVTVSRNKSGRYFASFQVEMEIPDPVYQGGENGIDLGLKYFAALSDGSKIANPQHMIQAERRLRRLQRSLSRRQKGSQGWERQRRLVARQHECVANSRADFQHKMSRNLVEDHRLLAIEDLNIKGMVRNRRLAKKISDAGWGQFIRKLNYKGMWYGCDLLLIDRWYPSSKTCSSCETVMETMPLNVREWECPICETLDDRDINAAKNILKQTTVGTTGSHAGGVHVRPVVRKQAGTAKPEAQQLAAG